MIRNKRAKGINVLIPTGLSKCTNLAFYLARKEFGSISKV